MRSQLRQIIFVSLLLGIVSSPRLQADSQPESKSTERPSIAHAVDPDLVQLHRDVLKAYKIQMKIRVTMQRGPAVKKIFRDEMIHFDQSGKWHLIKDDPLQNDHWEVYSLGKEQRQLYVRKNHQPFRFASDPIELTRWLEAALQDFYKLVAAPRQKMLDELRSNAAAPKGVNRSKKTFHKLSGTCQTWDEGSGGLNKSSVHLCLSDEGGVILEGSYQESSTESSGDYPLVTTVEANLQLLEAADAVKAVETPSTE